MFDGPSFANPVPTPEPRTLWRVRCTISPPEEQATISAVEHNGSTPRAAEPIGPSTRALWIPLVVVIVVLAMFVIVPVVVTARVQAQRAMVTDFIDPARLRATDVTSFLAEQMFAIGMRRPSGLPSADQRYAAALAAEHRGALALDSLLQYSTADALERFAEYREASTRWHDDVSSMTVSPNSAVLDTARMDGDTAITAARHLVQRLEQLGVSARTDVRRWERVDVLITLFLAPLALLACVLVVRAGQHMVRLAETAERDRRALAAAMDQKSAFMRGISHDLQNPLGAALGNVDLMLEGVTKADEQRDALLRVRRLTKRASDTVASLLTLARSDTGELVLNATPIDLVTLTRAAADDHSFMAGAKEQTVELNAASQLRAMGDTARVRHIVDNLLSNASKYTPRGGRIRVYVTTRMRDARRWASVTVQDSGPGIPSDWRERVFEEYARVPAARALAPGFGIGLAMSRRMARIMGGDLTVDAEEDAPTGRERLGGASVTLWLALADES